VKLFLSEPLDGLLNRVFVLPLFSDRFEYYLTSQALERKKIQNPWSYLVWNDRFALI